MNTSTDRIERKILLKAPRSRVSRALSNARNSATGLVWRSREKPLQSVTVCRDRSPIPVTNTSSLTC